MIDSLLLKELFGIFMTFVFSWYYLPLFSRKLEEKKFISKDPLKPYEKFSPLFAGVVPVLSVLIVSALYLILFPYHTTYILAFGFIILINGLLGLLDDLLEMRYRDHILAMLISGLFIVFLFIHKKLISTIVYIPFIGWIDLGILYYLVIILGFIFVPNAVNIYALTDGLAIGNALLLAGFFIIYILLISGPTNFAIPLLLITFFAYVVLLYYNKYPSKVFPGDVGTLSIGGALAICLIIGKIEFIACLAMIPYFLQFFCYLVRELKGIKDSRIPKVLSNGTLVPPEKDKYKVMYWFLKRKPMKEWELTKTLIIFQTIICVLVLLIVFLSKYLGY